MIDALKRKAARILLCAVVVGVWLSGLFGWLGTVATAPFAIGLIMHVMGEE